MRQDDLESTSRELAALKAEDIRKDAELTRLRRASSSAGGSGGSSDGAGNAGRLRELAEALEDKNAMVLRLQQENDRLRRDGGSGSGGGDSAVSPEMWAFVFVEFHVCNKSLAMYQTFRVLMSC